MQLWLNDPNNIDKLLNVKSDLREASKRRHGLDSSSDRSSPLDNIGELATHRFITQQFNIFFVDDYSNDSSSLAKKPRVNITDEQKEALNIAFFMDQYPGTSDVEFLSQELGLETKSINNWFHNHRMRLKQIHGVAVENLPTSDGPKFDPVKFKLLLNHRKMELQGQQAFPFLGGFNPAAAMFGLGLGQQREGEAGAGGLDLRFKTSEDDEAMSETGSDKNDEDRGDQASRSGRRKPAAPQWVNPGVESVTGDKTEKEEPINGVCVRNIAAFSDETPENPVSDTAL